MMDISSNSHRMMSNILFEVISEEIKKRCRRNSSEINGLECNALYQEANRQRRLIGKNEPIALHAVSSIFNNTKDGYKLASRLAELVLFDFVEITDVSTNNNNKSR